MVRKEGLSIQKATAGQAYALSNFGGLGQLVQPSVTLATERLRFPRTEGRGDKGRALHHLGGPALISHEA